MTMRFDFGLWFNKKRVFRDLKFLFSIYKNDDVNETDNESLSDEENLEYRMKSTVQLKDNDQTDRNK